MVRLECEHCGGEFLRSQRTGHGGKPKRFCSPKCRYAEMRGEKHQNYREGRFVPKSPSEYVTVLSEGHPRAHRNRVKEHILIAERTNGGSLPAGAEVHHKNGIKTDNRPENLVVCASRKEHMRLEAEARRLKDTGDLGLRRCCYCKDAKPLDDYHRSRANWDGRTNACKNCVRRHRLARRVVR